MSYRIDPIGTVAQDPEGGATLTLEAPYRPGLRHLDRFSHVIVLWWATGHDTPEQRAVTTTELPYAPGVEAGVFACRSEYRPNPIGVSVCPIAVVDAEAGVVQVAAIDAYDGTPILDLKPYIGVVDRAREVTVPDWFAGWPEWLPEEGIGLFEE